MTWHKKTVKRLIKMDKMSEQNKKLQQTIDKQAAEMARQ